MLDYHISAPPNLGVEAPQLSATEAALRAFRDTEAAVSAVVGDGGQNAPTWQPAPTSAAHGIVISLSLPVSTTPYPLSQQALAAVGGSFPVGGSVVSAEEAVEALVKGTHCLTAVGSTPLPAASLVGNCMEWTLAEDHLLLHLGTQHEDLLRGYLRAQEVLPEIYPKPFSVWQEAAKVSQLSTTSRRSISQHRHSSLVHAAPSTSFPESLLSDRYAALLANGPRRDVLRRVPFELGEIIARGTVAHSPPVPDAARPRSRMVAVETPELAAAREDLGYPARTVNPMTIQLLNPRDGGTTQPQSVVVTNGDALLQGCGLIAALSRGGHGSTIPIDLSDSSWSDVLVAEAGDGHELDAREAVLNPDTIRAFLKLVQHPELIQRFLDKSAEHARKTAVCVNELLEFQNAIDHQRQQVADTAAEIKRGHIAALRGQYESMLAKDINALRAAYNAHIAKEVRAVEHAWDERLQRMDSVFEFDRDYIRRSVAGYLPSHLRAHHTAGEALMQVMEDDFGLTASDLSCGGGTLGRLSISAVATSQRPPHTQMGGVPKLLLLSQAFVAPAVHEELIRYAAAVCSAGELRVMLEADEGDTVRVSTTLRVQQRRYEFLGSLMCLPPSLCRVQEVLPPLLDDGSLIALHSAVARTVPVTETQREEEETDVRLHILRTTTKPKSWETLALDSIATEVSRRSVALKQAACRLSIEARRSIHEEIQSWLARNAAKGRAVMGVEGWCGLCFTPPLISLDGLSPAALPYLPWSGVPPVGGAEGDALVLVGGSATVVPLKCAPSEVTSLVRSPFGPAKRPAEEGTVPPSEWATFPSVLLHAPNEPARLVSTYTCTVGHSATPAVFEVTIPAGSVSTGGPPVSVAVGLVSPSSSTPWGTRGILWHSSGLVVLDGVHFPTGASFRSADTVGVELGMLDGRITLYRNGCRLLPTSSAPHPASIPSAPIIPGPQHILTASTLKLNPGTSYAAAVELFVPIAPTLAANASSRQARGPSLGAPPSCSPALARCLSEALGQFGIPAATERTVSLSEATLAEAIVNMEGPFAYFHPDACSLQSASYM